MKKALSAGRMLWRLSGRQIDNKMGCCSCGIDQLSFGISRMYASPFEHKTNMPGVKTLTLNITRQGPIKRVTRARQPAKIYTVNPAGDLFVTRKANNNFPMRELGKSAPCGYSCHDLCDTCLIVSAQESLAGCRND
jgi:hypothetical protein